MLIIFIISLSIVFGIIGIIVSSLALHDTFKVTPIITITNSPTNAPTPAPTTAPTNSPTITPTNAPITECENYVQNTDCFVLDITGNINADPNPEVNVCSLDSGRLIQCDANNEGFHSTVCCPFTSFLYNDLTCNHYSFPRESELGLLYPWTDDRCNYCNYVRSQGCEWRDDDDPCEEGEFRVNECTIEYNGFFGETHNNLCCPNGTSLESSLTKAPTNAPVITPSPTSSPTSTPTNSPSSAPIASAPCVDCFECINDMCLFYKTAESPCLSHLPTGSEHSLTLSQDLMDIILDGASGEDTENLGWFEPNPFKGDGLPDVGDTFITISLDIPLSIKTAILDEIRANASNPGVNVAGFERYGSDNYYFLTGADISSYLFDSITENPDNVAELWVMNSLNPGKKQEACPEPFQNVSLLEKCGFGTIANSLTNKCELDEELLINDLIDNNIIITESTEGLESFNIAYNKFIETQTCDQGTCTSTTVSTINYSNCFGCTNCTTNVDPLTDELVKSCDFCEACNLPNNIICNEVNNCRNCSFVDYPSDMVNISKQVCSNCKGPVDDGCYTFSEL